MLIASDSATDRIRRTVEHLAHLLPAQGPIGVFIHQNTLHAFEHLPFEEAVQQASRVYGAEPYLTEAAFRREFARGRITERDVEDVLSSEPDASAIPFSLSRRDLRRAILIDGRPPGSASESRWWLLEGGASPEEKRRFELCRKAMARRPLTTDESAVVEAPSVDTLLIRLSAAFFDQGVSRWAMGDRADGFLEAVRRLLGAATVEPFRGVRAEMLRQLKCGETALDTVAAALADRNIPPADEEEFLRLELLALAGWAGLFHRLEHDPALAPHEVLPCRLMDYLAVRLTLRRVAPEETRSIGKNPDDKTLERAAQLYAGLEALRLQMPASDTLCEEVLLFDEMKRRRVWHLAYERQHERLVLGPLVARFAAGLPPPDSERPPAQVMFCIDEREESMRRHLEEIDPGIETLGAPGFFGIAMQYAGIDDAHGADLCPVVVKPRHAVRERPASGHAGPLEWRKLARRKAMRLLWSRFAQSAVRSTQSLWLGWISTALLGVLSLFQLSIRVLAPRSYRRLRARLNDLFLPVPRTELTLMREDEHAHHLAEGMQLGFDTQEKVDRIARVLGPAGLMRRFSRIVLTLGHGSTSWNNPHESAHDCGACGGRRGGPSGRIFAAMANLPAVREGLRAKGIAIPDDTWFVGGYHDTSSDEVEVFDLDALPASHRADLDRVRRSLDAARAANALERCRRFESANSAADSSAGLRHVEARAEHLAEPRPEYGHCTNAVALVGGRDLTRGLFLDRRWFLISYDPTQDDAQGSNLEGLLAAGGPVCAGISLEYYFSFVDNTRYGCGTKLPHNITGLIGVMDGHSSDLRTGLPLQMVEIHEPVRILFVIESAPAKLAAVVGRIPAVEQLVRNRWVRVAAIDPDTRDIFVLRDGGFEPFTEAGPLPATHASRDWYRGKLEHLPVSAVGAPA